MKTRSIYLSARCTHREDMLAHAETLRALGYAVMSRWIEGRHGASYEDASEVQLQIAAFEDREDVRKADTMLCFTKGSGASRGDMHTVLGMAIQLRRRIIIVGERRQVFHHMLGIEVCASFAECLDLLPLDFCDTPCVRRNSSTRRCASETAAAWRASERSTRARFAAATSIAIPTAYSRTASR